MGPRFRGNDAEEICCPSSILREPTGSDAGMIRALPNLPKGARAMLDALDPVMLARIQFGFTVSFHFIFPSFSIGLASFLMVLVDTA